MHVNNTLHKKIFLTSCSKLNANMRFLHDLYEKNLEWSTWKMEVARFDLLWRLVLCSLLCAWADNNFAISQKIKQIPLNPKTLNLLQFQFENYFFNLESSLCQGKLRDSGHLEIMSFIQWMSHEDWLSAIFPINSINSKNMDAHCWEMCSYVFSLNVADSQAIAAPHESNYILMGCVGRVFY